MDENISFPPPAYSLQSYTTDLRRGLQGELEGEAGEPGPLDVLQRLEGVEVDVPGGGQEDGQEVAHGHGGEDGVGGGPHGGPGQHDDDGRVGDEGDQHQDWHEVAVDRLDQLDRSQPTGGCRREISRQNLLK